MVWPGAPRLLFTIMSPLQRSCPTPFAYSLQGGVTYETEGSFGGMDVEPMVTEFMNKLRSPPPTGLPPQPEHESFVNRTSTEPTLNMAIRLPPKKMYSAVVLPEESVSARMSPPDPYQ